MTEFGIDYAWGRPSVASMRKAGVKFVCRYLSHDRTGKNLDLAEAKRVSDAGIDVVVVWETTAARMLDGYNAGKADALAANTQAKQCGMPDGRPIYFAADWDATYAQQKTINAYLDGAASVIGRNRVGMYAGYWPLKRAMDAGKCAWGWQTYAWSGGRWYSGAHIRQYSNGHRLDGVGVDYNHSMKSDFGQWKVGGKGGTDVELSDKVQLHEWIKKEWPKDEGLADGVISVNTSLGSGYAFARMAKENGDTILKRVADLEKTDKANNQAILDRITTLENAISALDLDGFVEKVVERLESLNVRIEADE